MHSRSLRPRGPLRARLRPPHPAALVASLLFLPLLQAAPARAETFHVDAAHASCSDAGPGSAAQPYCTIGAALAARRAAGTTVVVHPGVYREQVTVAASGTAAAPYVIRAAGPGVVVDGADDLSDPARWTPAAGGAWLAASVTWSPRQVFVDGARLVASTADPASLPPGSFRHVAGAGLYVHLGGDHPGLRATFVGRRSYGFRLSGRSWVTVEGFTVMRTEDRGFYLSSFSNHCTILDNRIERSGGSGIYASTCLGLTARGNEVSDSRDHGIALSGVGSSVLEDNRSCHNALPGNLPACGVYLTASSTGNILQRNELFSNRGSGTKIASSSHSNLLRQNLAWGNGEHGYEHSSAPGTRHVGDVACHNALGGFTFKSSSTGATLHNCIAVENGGGSSGINLSVDSGSRTGFVSDFNILWSPGGGRVSWGGSAQSVATYRAASGQDLRSLEADPMFTDPASGLFHLRPGSPAIDAGTSAVDGWSSTDFHEQARFDEPGSANTGEGPTPFADRGACEFVRTGTPPEAALSVAPASGAAPLDVVADASASHDHDGVVVAYRFDFGDGTVVGPQPGPVATHRYAAGGWTAMVEVFDDAGDVDTAWVRVAAIGANQPPQGTIGSPAAHVMIAAGQSVRFSASVTDPDGPAPVRHHWDFGGGAAPAGVEDPGSVTFDTPGTYTVTYLAIDGAGLHDPDPPTCVVTVRAPVPGVVADGIHWTFTGPTSVTFDWRGSASTIRYGLTPAYGQSSRGSPPVPYPFSSGGPYWEARLNGLLPDTVYHYSIGGGPDHTFRTPPRRGDSGFTLFVQGDVGSTVNYPYVAEVQAQIAAQRPDFCLVVGDLTYADDKGQHVVDVHFNDVMAWSRDAAYMPAWGNHEWGGLDNLNNYKGRFELPNDRSSPGSPAISCCGEDWYWFDHGNVRFIGYPEPWTGAWADWQPRAAALMQEAMADTAIDFIVTFGHRPAYSSGKHGGDATLQAALDALGDAHSKYVLNVSGHDHDYERSHRRHGVIHVVAGTGGSSLGAASGTCKWARGCPAPEWSAFRAMHYVAFRLDVADGVLEGRALCGPTGNPASNDLVCTPGAVIDSFVIGERRDPPPLPNRAPVAALALASAERPEGIAVTADAAGSTDPDGDALAYRFDFGDGSPVGPQAEPSATRVLAAGSWTVTVVVSDARGAADTASATVVVAGNLVRNPSFEASLAGWNANGTGAALARVAGGRADGFCAEARGAATLSTFGINDSPNWVSGLVAGEVVRFGAWVRSASHGGRAHLRVREYLNGVQQGPTVTSALEPLSPAWRWITVDATATVTGSSFDFQVLDKPLAAGEVFQVDDVLVVRVPAAPAGNRAPRAALRVDPAQGPAPLRVTADAGASTDPDGQPLEFRFDFGDGSTAGPQPAAVATHDYGPGAWTLTVIVTDAAGGADTATAVVLVAANLVRNGSFEASLTGWNANGSGGPTVARVAGGREGGFCAEARAGSGLGAFGINDAPNWVSPHGGPGSRVRFSAWVRSEAHRGRAWIRVREYANGVLQGTAIASPAVTLGPAWQPVEIEVAATAAGGTFDFQVVCTPATAGEIFQIDDVAAYAAPAPAARAAEPLRGGPAAIAPPAAFAARLYPNPPAGFATLQLETTRRGFARVHLHDTQGRVVRTLLDDADLPPGRHLLRFDTGRGAWPGPGMYFYRVQAAEGRRTGKFAVLE